VFGDLVLRGSARVAVVLVWMVVFFVSRADLSVLTVIKCIATFLPTTLYHIPPAHRNNRRDDL
jgi:hypothetical protein